MPRAASSRISTRMSRMPAGVEARCRLVEKQEARIAQQGGGDSQSLAHAVGVAADFVLGPIGELDNLENLIDPAPGATAIEGCAEAPG